MIWRIIGFFINPFVALAWPLLRWAGRGIDRLLGPVVGWYFALLIVLFAGAGLASSVYIIAPSIGRLTGLADPVAAETASGRILAVELLDDGKLTIKQRITVVVRLGNTPVIFEEGVTQPSTRGHKVGDAVTVYLQAGQSPTTRNPNDPVLDVVITVFGIAVPLAFLYLALQFLRDRKSIRDEYQPPVERVPLSSPQLRRGDRVPSTAERLKADELRVRQRIGR